MCSGCHYKEAEKSTIPNPTTHLGGTGNRGLKFICEKLLFHDQLTRRNPLNLMGSHISKECEA